MREYKKAYHHQRKMELKELEKQYKEELKQIKKINDKQYRTEHKQEIKLQEKIYREANKETRKEYHKKYVKAHRELCNMCTQRRYARKKQLPHTLTMEQWETCKQHFGNSCAYCGEEKPLEQEHFIALSKGGGYTHDNIIPACRHCNGSKHDKDFMEWYPKYEFYSEQREQHIYNFIGDGNK